jgi:hypothetical protein
MVKLKPLMCNGSFSIAAERIVAKVQAAPPISPRILSIFAAGLILIPPESNVTPLPELLCDGRVNKYFFNLFKSLYRRWQLVWLDRVRYCK